ncbi:DUF2092 domain-containing protein [Aquibium carbonis]|uniref:DUF2092 domain-containing protein n=1 Tax=Aquibium carbonis TaxID=2495581 RepID=UPI000F87305F|nr:DUF2092 domain-containing protein [Aquibium carbonis]
MQFGGRRNGRVFEERAMSRPRKLRMYAFAPGVWLLTLLVPLPASAQPVMSEDADAVLKRMSDYLGGLSSLSMDYEADLEFITGEGQKLQSISTGSITLSRPDGLHITRFGPLVDSELFYDGQTISLSSEDINSYFQMEASDRLDVAIEEFRVETGFTAAGADLLLTNTYEALNEGVVTGDHVGSAVIDGVVCYHLAFRGKDVDWQIWIRGDEQPLPMKYVITTKWMTGAPQYSVRLRNWNIDPQIDDDLFKFEAPSGAKRLDALTVDEIGEIADGAQQ